MVSLAHRLFAIWHRPALHRAQRYDPLSYGVRIIKGKTQKPIYYETNHSLRVELDKKAAAILQKKINGQGRKIIVGNAAQTTLNDSSADKLYGETILTMQSDKDKRKIMQEVAFHQFPLIEDENLRRIANGRQPVSNHEHGLSRQ